MHAYEVGKLYHPGRTTWPETSEFNYRGGECELRLFFRSPTPSEIGAGRSGRSEFALFHQDDQIIFCYRFDAESGRAGSGIPWSDAPYHFGRLALAGLLAKQRTIPPDPARLGPETRALLHIRLIDAATGLTQVLRVVSLSPEFTRTLFRAIRDQARRPFDLAAYDQELASIYAGYSSEQLAAAAVVRCEGGGIMTRIPIPSAKLNVLFSSGKLPAIDPGNPEFILALGPIEIHAKVNAKAARKLTTHTAGVVLQGRLVVEAGRLNLLDAGFQFLEPKPAAPVPEAGGGGP
jgi:hypothetical protein